MSQRLRCNPQLWRARPSASGAHRLADGSLLHFIPSAICEDEMSNLDVMRVHAPRLERTIGLRWLRHAMRAVLLSLHQSRRREARRIVRQSRHLRGENGRAGIGRPEPK